MKQKTLTALCCWKQVAPHAGAWVETFQFLGSMAVFVSRPMRARGLKLSKEAVAMIDEAVAPHAGAWVET